MAKVWFANLASEFEAFEERESLSGSQIVMTKWPKPARKRKNLGGDL